MYNIVMLQYGSIEMIGFVKKMTKTTLQVRARVEADGI